MEIIHAIENCILVSELDGFTMFVGPTFAGELLEVGARQTDDEPDSFNVFHAMRARTRFLHHDH